jgi:hypothetical protein
VNNQKVDSTKDLARLTSGSDHAYWKLTLERNGRTMETVIGG